MDKKPQEKETEDSITVTLKEYKSLMDDSDMLRALYRAGVRDTPVYEQALKEFER